MCVVRVIRKAGMKNRNKLPVCIHLLSGTTFSYLIWTPSNVEIVGWRKNMESGKKRASEEAKAVDFYR